jgi:hypothetical protein
MNLNIEKKTQLNKNTNFLIYSIENTETPYIYYHMIKDHNNLIKMPNIYIKSIQDCNQFMKEQFNTLEYNYIGTINYNDENIVIYELLLLNHVITNIYYNDSWWKVLPFEILYTQTVLQFKIDPYCIHFFKLHPQLFYIFDVNIKYEVPIVVYLGIDNEELNQQILLNDINYKKGNNGYGYWFTTLEEAYYRSIYDDLTPEENLIKLHNKKYIHYDTLLENNTIITKDDKFYLNNIYIGEVPKYCNKNTSFKLYTFNNKFIYILSDTKLKLCNYSKDEFTKKDTEGYIMRYVIFLKNINYDTKKGYNSYYYKKYNLPSYMVKKQSQISLVSYHNSQYKFIDKLSKNINILIK